MEEPLSTFKLEDAAQMRGIEQTVAKALTPYRNGRTETLLVVFALLRIARILLRLYPKEIQDKVAPMLAAFLQGNNTMPGAEMPGPLWTPTGKH